MNFREFLKSGRVCLDGAMGTELIKRGYKTGTELLSVDAPDVLTEIHASYVRAGSDAVLANTFGANGIKADLSEYTLEQLIFGAAEAAFRARPKYVLYDCGPLGELLYPNGRLTFDEAYELFREQAVFARKAGFDGALIETMGDLKEMRCALLAFKENTDLPVMCSMSFEENGRTFLGADAACFALTAQALGADAVGVNCGLGPDKALSVMERIAEVARVPLLAKPNAGLPIFRNGETVYDMDKEAFALCAKKLAEAGASVIGGCCGTDPEFIRLTKQAVAEVPFRPLENRFDGVCSYASRAEFGKGTLIIGERVNPTNKPLLKQALKDGDFDYILGMCLEQREEGADMLDINAGLPGEDEAALLKRTIVATQGVVALPYCIDTAKKSALEDALRAYDGVALINSVSGEKSSMERVFPAAVKYGAYVIALCMDDGGIPKEAEKRLEIAEKIVAEAEKYGLGSDRLLFDPLTLAVSVDGSNGRVLLEVLDGLRARGLKTVLGLSNISYGLPARGKLNGALLGLIRKRGVTAAIVNPCLKENEDEASVALLTGKDPRCERYIAENAAAEPERERKTELSVRECVTRGLTGEGMRCLRAALTPQNAERIVEEEIIGGLDDLGERYERGAVFLPGLIAGSETARAMLDYLKAACHAEQSRIKATVVIATVKGDVHDIGKNIVKTVASNYGYRMIDLGRDVPTEKILAAVEEYRPQAVALSALMTTTLDSMTETAAAVRDRFPQVKILVGGAVVTEEYARNAGAYYSKDAREACVTLEKLFSKQSG